MYPLEKKQAVVFTEQGLNSKPKQSNITTVIKKNVLFQNVLRVPAS
jgi:hypothetical protein